MTAKIIVCVESFSYRHGIPPSETEHGGGYVFDARCLPNPGREEEYKNLTGRDEPVRRFIERCPESRIFLFHITSLIGFALDQYRVRGYQNLLVQFGCTGGQHRSVYSAEYLRAFLLREKDVAVSLHHRGLGICEP